MASHKDLLKAQSFITQRFWYAQQLDPRNPIFNTGHCTGIRGEVNI